MAASRREHEVVIVGAGPAGIAAGIAATRFGLDAVVIDRARFPRDKTCGDGLTTGALRALEHLGFDVRALPSYVRITETVLVSPAGRHISLPLPSPDRGEFAGVVPRAELDAALVTHARALGVNVREGVRVTDATFDDDQVVLTLDDGASTLAARHVIAADGHYSAVRRLLVLDNSDFLTIDRGPTRRSVRKSAGGVGENDFGTWHAFRQYFSGVHDPRLWVVFDADLLPGYAWVFPVGGGRANVGFGVLRADRSFDGHHDAPSGKRLAALWRDLLERKVMRDILGPNAEPEGTHRAWPIPASFDASRLAHGRVLFAGDAAHVVDPMTGEGIAQALDSGMLAARAVARHATPEQIASRYRRDVDRHLGSDLRFAGTLQRILSSRIGAETAIGAAALTPWTRRNFARWMFEDYPRAALFTPRRWRARMFTEPGAYL
ncbi:MAG: geranylgeranyl reductase family protein [Acidimicrobiia bacterium]